MRKLLVHEVSSSMLLLSSGGPDFVYGASRHEVIQSVMTTKQQNIVQALETALLGPCSPMSTYIRLQPSTTLRN